MFSVSKSLEREEKLISQWQGKGKAVKKFEALGVKVVQDESGTCFLISAEKAGIFNTKLINFGACEKTLDEKGALQILKDFCLAPIKGEIDEKAQADFEICVGAALPEQVLRQSEFVDGLTAQLGEMQQQSAAEDAEKTFAPLYASIGISVEWANMSQDGRQQQFYDFLDLAK